LLTKPRLNATKAVSFFMVSSTCELSAIATVTAATTKPRL
jgi:hypothetical protein